MALWCKIAIIWKPVHFNELHTFTVGKEYILMTHCNCIQCTLWVLRILKNFSHIYYLFITMYKKRWMQNVCLTFNAVRLILWSVKNFSLLWGGKSWLVVRQQHSWEPVFLLKGTQSTSDCFPVWFTENSIECDTVIYLLIYLKLGLDTGTI